ncbi:oxidoreductase [Segetibacter sp. 3557_3]|uniref:WD40/YVTN/BNR-like repeat-containing protein n=1 Tax=Segetibacter sp. 3557_3 TaxID=2547429 RepID=UPI001058EFB9|nr:oxidoreductase [Segetibacter sp. 3557_3]TDH27406.1 oxidoreductase [Segetibacter sp. 3557_3]
MRNLITVFICLAAFFTSFGQTRVNILTSGLKTNLRGLSVPTERILWVSGSNGTVGRSLNGGTTWKWQNVPGYGNRDFRDIEAFDSGTAIIMAIDNPAIILKTTDGGLNWKLVFKKEMDGIFLDAMDFKNTKTGICIGDPLPGTIRKFYMLRTLDGGDTWQETPEQAPPAAEGEAIFAASGTNITFVNDKAYEYVFVSGGLVANLYQVPTNQQKRISRLPLRQGNESSGAFSVTADKRGILYAVGGDYKAPADTTANFVAQLPVNKGHLFATRPPFGFRSCIRSMGENTLVTCGTSGVDVSNDSGRNWRNVSLESFNVCMIKGKAIYLAGEKGRVAILK